MTAEDPLLPGVSTFHLRGRDWIVTRRRYSTETHELTVTFKTTEDFIADGFIRELDEAEALGDTFGRLGSSEG